MLESGSSGSVRGVPSNGHPYRDPGPDPFETFMPAPPAGRVAPEAVSRRTFGHARGPAQISSSSNVFASYRSAVSDPSVNQP